MPPTRRTTQRRQRRPGRSSAAVAEEDEPRLRRGSASHEQRTGRSTVRCGRPAAIQPPAGRPAPVARQVLARRRRSIRNPRAAPTTDQAAQPVRHAGARRCHPRQPGPAAPACRAGRRSGAAASRQPVAVEAARAQEQPGQPLRSRRGCDGRIDRARVELLDDRARAAPRGARSRVRASSSSSRLPSAPAERRRQASPGELGGARRRQHPRGHPPPDVQLLGAGHRERHDRGAGPDGDQRGARCGTARCGPPAR